MDYNKKINSFTPESSPRKQKNNNDDDSELDYGTPAWEAFHYDTMAAYNFEGLKRMFLAVTLFPVKFVCVITLLLSTLMCAQLSMMGLSKPGAPFSPVRNLLMQPVRIIARLLLFFGGYYYIKVKGKPDKNVGIIVSNHISFIDSIFYVSQCLPAFVSKTAVLKYPIIGNAIMGLQSITVDRNSEESKKAASEEIQARSVGNKKGLYPPLLIFPEGTTTNGKGLIKFRVGAFVPGVPVQPVVIRYIYKHFNPSICYYPIFSMMLILLCQVINYMEVTYLDAYYPSEEEKKDPKLYAENVRQYMAKHTKLPLIEANYSEAYKFEKK